jgi:hypothetical protein
MSAVLMQRYTRLPIIFIKANWGLISCDRGMSLYSYNYNECGRFYPSSFLDGEPGSDSLDERHFPNSFCKNTDKGKPTVFSTVGMRILPCKALKPA